MPSLFKTKFINNFIHILNFKSFSFFFMISNEELFVPNIVFELETIIIQKATFYLIYKNGCFKEIPMWFRPIYGTKTLDTSTQWISYSKCFPQMLSDLIWIDSIHIFSTTSENIRKRSQCIIWIVWEWNDNREIAEKFTDEITWKILHLFN